MRAVHSAAATSSEAQLYERHADVVYRYCLRTLGSHEDAEDAVQTTFFQAVRAMRRGVVPTFEQAWLLAIAKNECRSRHRANGRRRRLELVRDPQTLAEVAGAPDGPDGTLIGVQEALSRLPETQRRALLLREWQGRSYDEIAQELGSTVPAVEALLFRARRALARELGAETKSRRGAVDVASLLAAVKSALGGGAAVKVAAGVIAAATVASVPGHSDQGAARTQPPPAVRVEAPVADASPARAREATTRQKRVRPAAARPRVATTRPRNKARAARPGIRRGEDAASPASPASGSAPPNAPSEQATGPPPPAPPDQPKPAPISAPSVPVPTPPPPPALLPEIPGVPELPKVEVPQLPQVPGVPELPQTPQLPLPDVPDVLNLPDVPDLPILP